MVHVVVRRGAAAGAVELRPALLAFRAGIDVHAGELLRDIHVNGLVEHAALPELLLADELMAGIDVAVRRDRNVLVTGAAATQALDHARALIEIDHEVEEGKRLAFLFALEHDVGQAVVLCLDLRQIVLGEVVAAARISRYRLDGQTVEARVRDAQHVVGEIQIMRGKRAACIVVEVRVALVDERLELRNDGVIAAGACDGLAELIVDLAAAV